MITLYTFGPFFGLPDGSPFVTKAMLLLKFAGLDFTEDRSGYRKAPKGKLPYIDDSGMIVADSTFIRFHIEEKYGFDFDTGLSDAEKATSWAVEKMCEDHLYWAIIDARWNNRANFDKGPARFFDGVLALIRPLAIKVIRNKTLKAAKAHGLGRHTRPEIERLAIRDLVALSSILGDKPYLMGDKPCAADAAVFASIASVLAPIFDTAVRTAAESIPSLVAYKNRLETRYFSKGQPA